MCVKIGIFFFNIVLFKEVGFLFAVQCIKTHCLSYQNHLFNLFTESAPLGSKKKKLELIPPKKFLEPLLNKNFLSGQKKINPPPKILFGTHQKENFYSKKLDPPNFFLTSPKNI